MDLASRQPVVELLWNDLTVIYLGTNLIHDFTVAIFSMKLAFFREKCPFPCFREIRDFFCEF